MKTERRFYTGTLEIRAMGEAQESRTVKGYAAVFNSPSENFGKNGREVREVIKPGAFDDVIDGNVVALFNHDDNQILARSKGGVGTLKLGTDNTGLWYEFEAPNTRAGNDLLESIRRGDVESSSFSFAVDDQGQTWEKRDGGSSITRNISKVTRLFDVSPVVSPAYPDATVALRSMEEFLNESPEPPVSTPEQLSEVSDWAARLGI